MRTVSRGGRYYRVCKTNWADPLDSSFSKSNGGRWNTRGEFGAIHLNRTVEVAAANARWQHRGRAIGLFDLRPEQRPALVDVTVPQVQALDVVTAEGIRELRLPMTYPYGIPHERCRPIGRRAYRLGLLAVACRSAAECTPHEWIGEELAWFDHAPPLTQASSPRKFSDWYPDVIP